MILGIGIDQIEVQRMGAKLENKALKEKIFSAKEILYCEGQGVAAQHFAARFCGKEAFLKALGTGWRGGFEFFDVEILPDDSGQPIVHLSGEIEAYFRSLNAGQIHISLSHLKDIASAIVIIEK